MCILTPNRLHKGGYSMNYWDVKGLLSKPIILKHSAFL